MDVKKGFKGDTMDKLLHIQTEEIQNDGKDTYFNHRYEPTPYSILAELFDQFHVNTSDTFVDFGCGMGRLNFYVHSLYGCNTIGIELNPNYYEDALKNLTTYTGKEKNKILFKNVAAENYQIQESDSIFYFFNPFSIEIFRKVVSNIQKSYECCPRTITIILYYPSSEYIYYLEQQTAFYLTKEVPVIERIHKDAREVFLLYQLHET